MNHAVIADTGPLYAAVDPDDRYHRRARRELKLLVQQRIEIVIAYPTLAEAYTLILHRLGNRTGARWLAEIQAGAAFLNPAPEDYRQATSRLSAFPDQAITIFDATVAVVARRLGIRVWTYDHHFDVMQSAVWR